MGDIMKLEERTARARAGRIRQGIRNYLETLAEIAAAYAAQDHRTLGYADWQGYVDGEFGAERLQLPVEHRQKAVRELRLAGMSIPAIASTVGASVGTVHADMQAFSSESLPTQITGTDGKQYASSRPAPSPLVEAITGEIQQAAERLERKPAEPWDGWSADQLELLDRLRRGETVVVSMRVHNDLIAWAEDNGLYVRIDRRTEWGNPFEIPDDGDRKTVIANYLEHYLPFKALLLEKLEGLKGKALGCWCAPEPCHGDVLKASAEGDAETCEAWEELAQPHWRDQLDRSG